MSAEEINFGQVESTRLLVKETGVPATVRDEVHAHTNHYIKKSRPYFPNTKLPTYIDFPKLLRLACLVWLASLFGCWGVVANDVPKELPLGFFIACAVFFLIYCQHEWVNQKSLPVVLKQPVFDDQRYVNQFYELTVTELKGMALENYRAGIGFVRMTQGKIKFQAFNKAAVEKMSRARCYSRLMLVLFFVTSIYNLVFMVLAYVRS